VAAGAAAEAVATAGVVEVGEIAVTETEAIGGQTCRRESG
jgi:hypothetical protein